MIKISLIKVNILFILLINFWVVDSYSQCIRDVSITITSINFRQGCDFNETNGMDAVLEIRSLTGNDLYLSEFENLSQVRSPQDNVVIDLNVNPNSCGNETLSFVLGQFPVDQLTEIVNVDIFDRDNIFPCAPYFGLFDDDLGRGPYTFDFNVTSGTIDVGSCMSFNYELESIVSGSVANSIDMTICPSDSIIVNGISYNTNNAIGNDTLFAGSQYGCDSIVDIVLSFYPEINLINQNQSVICPQESLELILGSPFSEYLWQDGSSASTFQAMGAGTYAVTVTDENGCQDSLEIRIEEAAIDTLRIYGDDMFCQGSFTTLSTDGNLYDQVTWSTGETSETIEVSSEGLISIEALDKNGCIQMANIMIVERSVQNPLEIMGDLNFCAGSELELSVDNTLYESIEWSTGETSQTITVSSSGTIGLTVVDDNGCTQNSEVIIEELAQDTIRINRLTCEDSEVLVRDSLEFENGCEVLYLINVELAPASDCEVPSVPSDNDFFVPNIINISQQNENGIFKISGPNVADVPVLLVYDRWGNLLHESSGVDAQWDGTYKNKLVSQGQYIVCFEVLLINGAIFKECEQILVLK